MHEAADMCFDLYGYLQGSVADEACFGGRVKGGRSLCMHTAEDDVAEEVISGST